MLEHIKGPFELYTINQWISQSVTAHIIDKMMYEYCITSDIMTPLNLRCIQFLNVGFREKTRKMQSLILRCTSVFQLEKMGKMCFLYAK
jgi:hypothetical protein